MTDSLFEEACTRLRKLEDRINVVKDDQKYDNNRITYVNQLVIDLEKKHEDRFSVVHQTCAALLRRIEVLEKKHTEFYEGSQAMQLLFNGYRLKRKSWDDIETIKLDDKNSYTLDVDDLNATDWMILD